MPLLSVLLRLLLSISLILNGSGNAMASMHVPMSPAGMQHVAGAPEQQIQPPCHEGANASTDAAKAIAADDAAGQGPAKPKPHSPDCCKSGACRCLCGHTSSAAIAVLLARDRVIEHATSSRFSRVGHAAPTLPHLIRPPIG